MKEKKSKKLKNEIIKLSWDELDKLVKTLYKKIPKDRYDAILTIADGGLVTGKMLSEMLDLNMGIIKIKRLNKNNVPMGKLYSGPPMFVPKVKVRKVLVVDDIINAGHTMRHVFMYLTNYTNVKRIDAAVLFLKDNKKRRLDFMKTDMYVAKRIKENEWVQLPYEK